MGIGLEVYNASGQRTLATGDYLPRFLGKFFINSTPGSVVDGNLSTPGTVPFFMFFPGNSAGFKTNAINCPYITISGNTISWNWADDGNTAYHMGGIVIYGLR
jgi:hypothetical protein